VILVTSDGVPGREATEVLGMVEGSAVRARNIGRDVVAGLRNIIGGEIPEYAQLMSQSREQAAQRMITQAESLGADAIVTVRYQTSMIAAGAAEILAYGTAVKLT